MARSDWFTKGFGAAVADIRAKLIDEAWFGRHEPTKGTPDQNRPTTIDFGGWGSGDVSPIGRNPDADNYFRPDAPAKAAPASSPEHAAPTPSAPDHGISH